MGKEPRCRKLFCLMPKCGYDFRGRSQITGARFSTLFLWLLNADFDSRVHARMHVGGRTSGRRGPWTPFSGVSRNRRRDRSSGDPLAASERPL